jgi:Lon protease-like protein
MRRTATSLSEVGAQAMIRQVVEHDNVRVELQLRGQRRGLIARLCGGSR